MATKPSGTAVPRHGAPFTAAEFCAIRLSRDPEEALAHVARILAESPDPDDALRLCSYWIDGHGVEAVTLADGEELQYVNKGDTYDATLCHTEARGYFVSSWGDVYEESDREREEDSGERRCAYCSEWTAPSDPCGSCGRDPESGEPVPDALRHVRLATGHVLRTWDTGRTDSRGQTRIGYALADAGGDVLFRGRDFCASPLHADDSDASVRALLGFLTLRPGDTDREYFDGYTAAQRAFAESGDCELLAFLYSEEGPGTFQDCEDGEEGGGL
jgi:hypothetical protein